MNQDYDILLNNSNGIENIINQILNPKLTFQNLSHQLLFCYFLGYFSSKYNKTKLNEEDLNNIYLNYQQEDFSQLNFQETLSQIILLFCHYYSMKDNNGNFPLSDSNKEKFNNNSNFSINNKPIISNSNHFNQNLFNSNHFNPNIFNSNHFNPNNYDGDLEFAKYLEEEERIKFLESQKNENEQKKKCEICLEEFSLLDPNNYFLNCNCTLHYKCFDEYIKSQVEENKIPIKCPNCNKDIHPNFIIDSLQNSNPQLVQKYDDFSLNNFVLNNNKDYSCCPTPGCKNIFFFVEGEPRFKCNICNKEYCLNCKDEWHKNLTCEQYKDSRDVNKLDQEFMKFVKGAKFKMCPKCKFWVEKNQGCNHMKCRCGTDFCYLCGNFMDMSRHHVCPKNKK